MIWTAITFESACLRMRGLPTPHPPTSPFLFPRSLLGHSCLTEHFSIYLFSSSPINPSMYPSADLPIYAPTCLRVLFLSILLCISSSCMYLSPLLSFLSSASCHSSHFLRCIGSWSPHHYATRAWSTAPWYLAFAYHCGPLVLEVQSTIPWRHRLIVAIMCAHLQCCRVCFLLIRQDWSTRSWFRLRWLVVVFILSPFCSFLAVRSFLPYFPFFV